MRCASTRRSAARDRARAIIEREELASPKFGYRILPGIESARLPQLAEGQSAVAAAVCTLGSALEARVSALFHGGERLLALELDHAGNELLYRFGDELLGAIGREARRRGLRAGDARSPGDPGLSLAHQRAVLSLASAGDCGVTASAGGMVAPVKSLSYVVPLGAALVRTAARPCARCPSRDRCPSVAA